MLIKKGSFSPRRIEDCSTKCLCGKITKIKALLSAIFYFIFFLHSVQIHSYTKFLKLKSTNKNAQNIIYNIKSYFPQPVEGARHTTSLQKLDCCILQKLEREWRFPFHKKYFKFLKWFLKLSEGIWQGQLTREGGESVQFTMQNSASTIITNTKLSTKKCY